MVSKEQLCSGPAKWMSAFIKKHSGAVLALIIAASLVSPAEVYGGFAGTETSLSERELTEANATVLSGDGSRQSIVTCSADTPANGAASNDTRLDGFTITGGRGVHYESVVSGGGMLNLHSSPTVANCCFIKNSANNGGGM